MDAKEIRMLILAVTTVLIVLVLGPVGCQAYRYRLLQQADTCQEAVLLGGLYSDPAVLAALLTCK